MKKSWVGHRLVTTPNHLALDGLRILDLSQVAAGPYATMFFGYMGAEVIKLESRSRMDINRGRARPGPNDPRVYTGGAQGERPYDRTAHHIHRNINKLSVTLDLADPKGKELFLGLIKVCDVLVENYRSTVMDRLGLGYDAVSQANPQLIYLKISSQGATGPEANYGSLGSTLEQTAGLASITGYEDGLPLMTNEVYPDPVVGILSFGALMAALRRRRQTGRGCLVDLSQREVTSMLLGESVLDFSVTGRVAATMGNKHRDMAPQGVYPCSGEDMWVAVSTRTDDEAGAVPGNRTARVGRRRQVQGHLVPPGQSRSIRRDNLLLDQRIGPLPGHAPAPSRGCARRCCAQGQRDHRGPAPGGQRILGCGRPPRSGCLQADDHTLDPIQKP